jgi:hypothetical protein
MQLSDRRPIEVHDASEPLDPTELGRIAHKIAWARMNGSVDAANPFVEADPNRPAPGGGDE